MPAWLAPAIAGGGALLGGLFGGSEEKKATREQQRLLEQARRMQEEQFEQTAPLREMAVQQLSAGVPTAGFFSGSNAFNRFPLPATLQGTDAESLPGAQNPLLPAISEQFAARGFGGAPEQPTLPSQSVPAGGGGRRPINPGMTVQGPQRGRSLPPRRDVTAILEGRG